ncbi:hypothetical protein DBT_1715 [Dissulfuribacter thermophilus]|uniref:Uncharacterized protein n=1 Tax=Dissulfuribacter thermophilus TaxID=1156395 RepID=A0A1B9F4R0_9BACT|nr:hypothetical protein DBT_1715 [Dissulfuribacter thermophilus]
MKEENFEPRTFYNSFSLYPLAFVQARLASTFYLLTNRKNFRAIG